MTNAYSEVSSLYRQSALKTTGTLREQVHVNDFDVRVRIVSSGDPVADNSLPFNDDRDDQSFARCSARGNVLVLAVELAAVLVRHIRSKLWEHFTSVTNMTAEARLLKEVASRIGKDSWRPAICRQS
jgi:hypothetical protein